MELDGILDLLAAVAFMGDSRILIDHIAHQLLEGELAEKIAHIQMDVQLLRQRQAGGGISGQPRLPAHTYNKFHRPGAMPEFGNPQQGTQQRAGNIDSAGALIQEVAGLSFKQGA